MTFSDSIDTLKSKVADIFSAYKIKYRELGLRETGRFNVASQIINFLNSKNVKNNNIDRRAFNIFKRRITRELIIIVKQDANKQNDVDKI